MASYSSKESELHMGLFPICGFPKLLDLPTLWTLLVSKVAKSASLSGLLWGFTMLLFYVRAYNSQRQMKSYQEKLKTKKNPITLKKPTKIYLKNNQKLPLQFTLNNFFMRLKLTVVIKCSWYWINLTNLMHVVRMMVASILTVPKMYKCKLCFLNWSSL